MQIVENIALISINETLLFQLVSFLVFLFILNRVMIRPLRRTMDERETFLELVEQDITAADLQYQDLARKIHKEEAVARRTAFKLRDKLEAEGQQAASDLINETKEEIQAMRTNAQAETDAKIAATRRDIRKEIDTLSDQMIASLLGRRRSS